MSFKTRTSSTVRIMGRWTVKALAFVWGVVSPFAAFLALAAIWVADARQLNWAFDENLWLIKWASAHWDSLNTKHQLLPWIRPGQLEAGARALSGEKVLLTVELGLIIRFAPMWGAWLVWQILRLCGRVIFGRRQTRPVEAVPFGGPASNVTRLAKRA